MPFSTIASQRDVELPLNHQAPQDSGSLSMTVTRVQWDTALIVIQDVLQGKKVERITFTEVTQKAVERALASPRQIDGNLVDAYKARRALDYLMGYNLSPILWRKLGGAKSAGTCPYTRMNDSCHGHPCILSIQQRRLPTKHALHCAQVVSL